MEQQQKRGKRLKENKAPFENCKTVTKNTAKMAIIVTREFSFVLVIRWNSTSKYVGFVRAAQAATSAATDTL
jgi:hypothetical protein